MVPVERIAHAIYLIRGEKVIIDADLARLYGVETRTLNQAVKRHAKRFPPWPGLAQTRSGARGQTSLS
jgi:hypothetical protein